MAGRRGNDKLFLHGAACEVGQAPRLPESGAGAPACSCNVRARRPHDGPAGGAPAPLHTPRAYASNPFTIFPSLLGPISRSFRPWLL